jgi:UDP-glucuronate decarboxylase
MKYLVTGAAGFLGSHLSEKLILKGHSVIGMDNLYTGSPENVARLSHFDKFRFISHDITVPFFIEVDGIFNLACPASPKHYQKFPVDTLRTSVIGSLNSLELAKQIGVPILQASTSEIYGDPKVSPQEESYFGNVNPFGVRSCYDEGKRAAETLFFDFHHHFGVEIKIARIFNTYGPHMLQDDGRVVSNFIVQALRNEDITIYGEGSQTRSFCYVDDLIDGLYRLFFTPSVNFPVNLGNPDSIAIIELANQITT